MRGRDDGPALIAIGGSWGGLEAASVLLARLDGPPPVPVLLVLHRSRRSDGDLVCWMLARASGHVVRELDEKEQLRAGTIHLAPPDYHVLVEEGGVSLSVEGPVNHSRPSIDLAFETAATEYAERLVAVLLTGAGRDGAAGIAAVKERGGHTLVEDPETAQHPDMPRAALATGQVDEVAPVDQLGDRLRHLLAPVSP
jgi:two-component system, chemotaxis family, protein-glutamate methylesterase/glutaminase